MPRVDYNVSITTGLRRIFLLVTPNETTFETLEEIPDYVSASAPFFASFVIVEMCISFLRGDGRTHINDGITSAGAGIFSKFNEFVHRYVELRMFAWIHENYRITNFDWSSPVAWWISFFGTDFLYYWFHRMAHEVNLFWAVHQTHHSSEFYNFTTALRQSVLQKFISWMFYQPMALVVSPVFFAVHTQFNLLFQFWIHTQYVRSLGPLEFLLNSPSHHRVHHGRNRYCIDKNYGGILIIWDRLFGTYQEESEEIVYGLTHPIESFNPIKIQVSHLMTMWSSFWKMDGVWNKWAVIWKGPGWSPGKPRRGNLDDLPDIRAPVTPYTVEVPSWCNVYVVTHFALLVVGFTTFMATRSQLSVLTVCCFWSYILLCLTSFGYIFENRNMAPLIEFTRCFALLVIDIMTTKWLLRHACGSISWQQAAFFIYILSSILWLMLLLKKFNIFSRVKAD